MKRILSLVTVPGLCLCFCLSAVSLSADSLERDLAYLGYSDEMLEHSRSGISTENLQATVPNPEPPPPTPPEPVPQPLSEPDSVQQQLTELGRTRSQTSHDPLTGEAIREEIDSFWMAMQPVKRESSVLSPQFKEGLRTRLLETLVNSGYAVKQIALLDMPANLGIPQVRAIVRVVKPLRTKDHYREIQNNLSEVKNLCTDSATLDGVLYLSEMTTFLAENPRTKYFYEKTILTP